MIRRSIHRLYVAWIMLLVSGAAFAQEEQGPPHGRDLLNDWTSILHAGSRVLIVGTSALGIVLAATSLVRAYNAYDDRSRTRHLGAALFSGVIGITGVVIGLVSRLLIPGG